MTSAKATCECKSVSFKVSTQPLMRLICHCSICQSFNNADYGDVLLYFENDVELPDEALLDYQAYRPPPNLQRGKCKKCAKPAVEYMSLLPLIPRVIVVPCAMVQERGILPRPSLQMFYENHKVDYEPTIPKYSGYLPSQLAMIGYMSQGLLKKVV